MKTFRAPTGLLLATAIVPSGVVHYVDPDRRRATLCGIDTGGGLVATAAEGVEVCGRCRLLVDRPRAAGGVGRDATRRRAKRNAPRGGRETQ